MLEHGGTAPGSAPCRQASHVGSAGAGIADSGDAGTVHDGLRHCLPRHDWGGEINAMEDQSSVDQEFFVRYAQLAALSPTMQFSVLPSRVLDETHYRAVRNAVETREQMMPVILGLAEESTRSGEPVIRPLAYEDASLADITDQFILGSDYVVAPVLEKGATVRSVTLPDGSWQQLGTEGEPIGGRQTITVPVTLETLPVFERVR